MIVAFIEQMRAAGHAVESIHQALQVAGLQVAARTLRTWCAAGQRVAERTIDDAIVEDTIRQIAFITAADGTKQLAPEGLYGRRKMLAAARRRLPAAGFGAVDRAMRTLGLSGVVRGKAPRTTIPDPRASRAADLLNRDFTAPAPDRVWVSDFTYVRTHTSFTYVAFVVDCFSQRIVGWNISTRRDVELVDVPVRMALWQRDRAGHRIEKGQLIAHSDAGSQYTSIRYGEHLHLEGIAPSVGSVGDAYDNALMETVNGIYKTECVRTDVFHNGPYRTSEDVEFATAAWVHWYNTRRLHGSLGMLTPDEYETGLLHR